MTQHYTPEQLAKTMDLEQFAAPTPIAWLEESWIHPDEFWPALWASHQAAMGVPAKSSPFARYDFFHDLVVRNRERKNPAMIWYDPLTKPDDPWQQLSFKELETKAGQIAAAWKGAGVKPGQVLCILEHPGDKFLIHLAAGLKLGVVLAFVHPGPRTWLEKQIEALDPDFICTQEIYLSEVQQWQDRVLERSGPGIEDHVNSYSYSRGEPVALIFDAMSEAPFEPRPVSSDLLFMCAVRDGFMGLRLLAGDIFTAPGFETCLTQPCFLLAALANGSTYLHLDMAAVENDPLLLTRYPLKVLGICRQLRNVLMQNPVGKVKIWDSWFRDPAQASDMDVWDHFIKKLALEDVPAGTMVWNAALGGCILFSRRRKGQALQNVLPCAGRCWHKAMPAKAEIPALDGFGLLSVAATLDNLAEEYCASPCFLAATYLEDIFLKLDLPSRYGSFYPGEVVEGVVKKIPGCRDSVIAEVPVTGKGVFSEFHLLVFSARFRPEDLAKTAENLRQAIGLEIGKKFLPDQIKFFPLVPRRDENNEVDRVWSVEQYLYGGLEQKSKDAVFLGISRLRALIT